MSNYINRIGRYLQKKYKRRPLYELYWHLNSKKMKEMEKKEVDSQKFLSEELKRKTHKVEQIRPL